MIPHRPWPLLFLTLALWTGASSAQTWTTVWTPGSAPAPTHTKMEQEMEPEKDHHSETNCYPCKEWEAYGDGGGKWVDYPDGTECDAGDDKPGKCCDGICVEVPPKGTDPCEWAIGNDDFRKKHPRQFHPVFGPEGFIVCIFEETYPCVPPDNIPQAWKNAGIDKCVQRHEQYHKDHSPIQCPPCGTGIGDFADAETQRKEECCAYYDTLLCLNDLLNAASDNHKATIQKAIDDATDKMLHEYHCWGGIDDQGIQYERVQMPCN